MMPRTSQRMLRMLRLCQDKVRQNWDSSEFVKTKSDKTQTIQNMSSKIETKVEILRMSRQNSV